MLKYTFIDRALIHFDTILRGENNIYAQHSVQQCNTQELNPTEKKQSIKMMRINHSGEVCAQALYHGQALMARDSTQYQSLMQAAFEENTHLKWCSIRLQELHARPSLLNPVWYIGSFAIGALAGAAGDKFSLGFLAETEYQVTAHLEQHLEYMSYNDQRSRSILALMREDEMQHATKAVAGGASVLPGWIKFAMRCTAKIMTFTAGKI